MQSTSAKQVCFVEVIVKPDSLSSKLKVLLDGYDGLKMCYWNTRLNTERGYKGFTIFVIMGV